MTQPIWVHRTLIVPASTAPNARALGAKFGPAADNMWLTPLSPTGKLPATHYISAGMVEQDFADMLAGPDPLVRGAKAKDVTLLPSQAQAVLTGATISDSPPFAVMAELGLKLIQTELP